MKIETIREQGQRPVTIFRITGSISAENYEELEAHGQAAVQAGTQDLLLDLSAVDFVSSSGLRAFHHLYMLLHADAEAEEVRRDMRTGSYEAPHLKLLNPNPHTINMLRMTGFDMVLGVYSDRGNAINAF